MGHPIISRRFEWASQSFLAGKEIMSSRTATAFANVRAELEIISNKLSEGSREPQVAPLRFPGFSVEVEFLLKRNRSVRHYFRKRSMQVRKMKGT
jgi:hypothetical protein